MNQIWQAVGVLTQATPSPSPTPGLREGLDESAISPGLAGFLAVFGIALVTVLLFYSLTNKLRGVRQRDGVAGPVVVGGAAGAGVVPTSDLAPGGAASEEVAPGAPPHDSAFPDAAGPLDEPDGPLGDPDDDGSQPEGRPAAPDEK